MLLLLPVMPTDIPDSPNLSHPPKNKIDLGNATQVHKDNVILFLIVQLKYFFKPKHFSFLPLVSAPPTLNTMTATHAILPIYYYNRKRFHLR